MLFNSYIFWLFFAAVYSLYRVFNHRWQNYLLLLASYIFYGLWDWRFLGLLFASTTIDYFVAIGIEEAKTERARKRIMLLSILVNLGILGTFKYLGFFVSQFDTLMQSLGIPISLPILHIILPVGISFYTFQSMSYTIDVYRKELKATRHFLDFMLFVSFFPQLVAGPIERASKLLPQVLRPRVHQQGDFAEGLYLVLIGLFKKIVIADNLAPITNAIFSRDVSTLTGAEVLIGVYAFAFQIYGDFAGYTDVARGTAKWLGFDLMLNFRMPYFAVSPSDFWQRWHISLSSWLRDYLYIPLGGNRGSTLFTYRNLMLTMLLGGLWHGAAWTFIIWGLIHGLILCLYRPFEKSLKAARSATLVYSGVTARVLQMVVMFHLICLGWLFFRADTVGQAFGMLGQLFTNFQPTPFASSAFVMILFYVLPLFIFEAWLERSGDLVRVLKIHWLLRVAFYSYLVLMLWFFPSPTQYEFVYFQF
jgi:alginate O-acetyltransferase complex protein AlgI